MAATKGDYIPAFTLKSPLDSSAKRVEIDEFVADDAMLNLFLLALEDMQNMKFSPLSGISEEEWFSYYNLSGAN